MEEHGFERGIEVESLRIATDMKKRIWLCFNPWTN